MTRRRPARLDPHLRLRARGHCHTRLSCDLQGLRLPESAAGFEWGTAAVVVALAMLAWHGRRHGGRHLPVAGLLMIVGILGALAQTGHLLTGLAVAVGALVAGGLLADRLTVAVGGGEGAGGAGGAVALRGEAGGARGAVASRAGAGGAVGRVPLRAGLAVPGAWLLAERAGLPGIDPAWVRLLVGAATVVASVAVADFDRRSAEKGLGPVLLAITAVGIYETVPDTDLALVLLGTVGLVGLLAVCLAMATRSLGRPWPLLSLGGGASAVVGIFAWISAVGGRSRPSAVIGGIACLGVLVAEPAGRLIGGCRAGATDRLTAGPRLVTAAAAAQLAVVYVAARLAGPRHDLAGAAGFAVAALAATAVAAALVGRGGRARRRSA